MSAPTGKLKFAYDSIANLEQEIATLRAQLAASEARAEKLDAMLQHRADEAAEMERMLRAELDKSDAQIRALHILLARYRDETPICHQPHMIAHQADAALGRAALAELDTK
jgi:septal ring factor EnvC (AmiA/AmiB activator)